jgi:hypothetical protein
MLLIRAYRSDVFPFLRSCIDCPTVIIPTKPNTNVVPFMGQVTGASLLGDKFSHQLGNSCTECHHEVGCSAFRQCEDFFFFFFPYGGRVLSSRNFLRMSIRWFSCSSSHFITMLTWLTGGRGKWVKTTCLRRGLAWSGKK